MANPIRVVGVADMTSMNAELGKASESLVKFGSTANGVFTEYSAAALKAQVASDKLAVSLAKVPEGSTAAAAAMLRYNAELDAMAAKQTVAMREIGTSMSKYITAPAVLVGLAALKLGTDFQSAMLRIQTQAGASAAEVKNLTGQVLDLAKGGAQQGPTQLAEGLYHLESLGLRGAAAMRALKVSSDAAALGQANLADITTALGGVIVTGIKGSSDYQKTMGTLNATIGAGNLTMDDLIGFLGTGVVPAAHAAGVSLDELGAALAVMTDRGIPAEQAGTRLRMTLALLQNQTPKASKALADMGIDSSTLATTLQSPNGLLKVIQMLHDGVASVGKVQGNKDLLGGFGGGRSGSAIQALVASVDSSTSSFQGKLQQIRDQSGRLATSEAAQQQTAAANFHRDIAKMEADLTSLGGKMLPTVTAIVNGVTKIGDGFSKLPGPVKSELGVIVGVLAVGGPLLLVVSGAARVIRSIGTSFGIAATESTVATTVIEGDLAGVGASADAAAANVGGLRAALLGLGAPEILGVLAAVGLAVSDIYLGHKALTTETAGGFAAGAEKSPYQKGSEFDYLYQAGLQGEKGTVKVPGGSIDTAHLNKQERAAYEAGFKASVNPAVNPNAIGPIAPPTAKSGGLTAAAGGVTPTLTLAQKIEAGLYLNPADVALLKEKVANDTKMLDAAKSDFAAGKINSAKYLAELQKYGTDRSAAEAAISAEESKTTSAANKTAAAHRRAIAARKRAAAAELRADETQARDRIDALKVDVAKAKLTHGNISDDEHALRSLEHGYATMAHNKELPAAMRSQAQAHAYTTAGELEKLRNTYTSPLGLGLDMAHATATNDFAGIRAAAEKEKQAALRAIKSGALGIEGMTDAWNIINQANQTLGSTAAFKTVKMSADKFVVGLGLHGADKRVAEMRFAQAMAHGGHAARYEGVQGIAAPTVVKHTTIVTLDKRVVGEAVTEHQVEVGRHRPMQTRGIHAGR